MAVSSALDHFSITLPCIKVTQPLGDFYLTSIPAQVLRQITFADVRRMQAREVDDYLGIQREVSPKRVKEIGAYVNTLDACFPTAVILAVEGRCAEYNSEENTLTLHSVADAVAQDGIAISGVEGIAIARILDGQHRIEGLQHLKAGVTFEVNVSIFVDIDIADQAYLFSVVNLAQTKVNKSLVYDLFDYARTRSPQKTAHNIAVALDRDPKSPLHQRIKRLGVATKGRFVETLTQATVVEALLPYLSAAPSKDRQTYLANKKPEAVTAPELRKQIFRSLFLEERDLEIADILFNYFSAVRQRWPNAWAAGGDGAMLTKTNGFRAFMRILRPTYLYCAKPGEVPSQAAFAEILARATIRDNEFNTVNFVPGSSGEAALFARLMHELAFGEVSLNE